MVQYIRQVKKGVAREMRSKGLSYSQIQNSTSIPKSTLAHWLKDIKLTDEQAKKLQIRQQELTRENAKKRILRTAESIKRVRELSASTIKNISKKELWLMGIILYWREHMFSKGASDLRQGVKFTSSDPYLIKLFLTWLQGIGGLGLDELQFDIFLRVPRGKISAPDLQNLRTRAIEYWSSVTGATVESFTHLYIQNVKSRVKQRKSSQASKGFLRVRVRASSMLARQIAGWISGIEKFFWPKEFTEN